MKMTPLPFAPAAALLLLLGACSSEPQGPVKAANKPKDAEPIKKIELLQEPDENVFQTAKSAKEKAVAADPQSAAAAFYLGYTFYKLGEPSRRMNENKQRARELFAKAYTLEPGFRPDWGRPAAVN